MNSSRITPESIAHRITQLIRQPNPPLRVPTGIDARIFRLMTRLIPRRIYYAILYRSLPGIKTWDTACAQSPIEPSDLQEIIP